jgi:hypothetical protein
VKTNCPKILSVIVSLVILLLGFGAVFTSPSAVLGAHRLDEPVLIEPINGENAYGTYISFTWETDEDEDNIERFRLQIYENDGGDLGDRIFNEYIYPSDWGNSGDEYWFDVDVGYGWSELDLNTGDRYWWRVMAYSDNVTISDSYWSDEESFRWRGGGSHDIPWIEIDSDDVQVEPGERITIIGDGWEDNEDIDLYFDGNKVSSFTARDTEWERTLKIPSVGSSDWTGYGMRSIQAKGDESGKSNYIWVSVGRPGPVWELSPSSGYTDTQIEAWGDYWKADDTVTVRFGGYEIDRCKVGSDGEWKCRFTSGDLPPGRYLVTAQSQTTDRDEVDTFYFTLKEEVEQAPIATEPEEPQTPAPTEEAPTSWINSISPGWFIGGIVALVLILGGIAGTIGGFLGSLGNRIKRNSVQSGK